MVRAPNSEGRWMVRAPNSVLRAFRVGEGMNLDGESSKF